MGDELWIYYRSTRLRRNQPKQYAVGLAKIRLDGFVSLDAGRTPGVVTTRPLSFSGKRLFINAEVAEGGSIRVELLSRKNKPLQNYSLSDSIPITTGAVKISVGWKQVTESQLPTRKHIRLRFELKHVKLYSFWVE
ncbi:MAG: hypothetical protein IH899_04680 [Planctomycetes bacterium]|nr:hypothetical protein [Planctomycetota bacterium]